MKEIELIYNGLVVLETLYAKLASTDFGSTKRSLAHLRDLKKLTSEKELLSEFLKTFMSKHNLSEGSMIKGEALVEYQSIMNEKVTIALNEFDFDILDKANLTPLQLIILEELGLTTIPE